MFGLNAKFLEVSHQNSLVAEVPNWYFGSRVTTRAELNEIDKLCSIPQSSTAISSILEVCALTSEIAYMDSRDRMLPMENGDEAEQGLERMAV
jgi:hypothetical protein